ncbi:small-conductance mechanosensitive channel [Paraburkholderia eburnea]|uniref:Small-conductance mechanosensitive channel n=1 Tax=Paraburkholderia eburnea TaxID=1189126 RepID=A0A2S4M8X7_9BURK|nr:small-conductance mechanosensitive channel [Paraburkholderia eburnea]PRZ21924.1 small-conductance mechanosensitive channel [Paraburkholderia eburnea]
MPIFSRPVARLLTGLRVRRLDPLIALLACVLMFAAVPSRAAAAGPASSANPAAPVVLTPAQAHAALQVLDDPVQRAHVADTLRAIAAAGALATPAAAASGSAAASGATGASAPAAASAASASSASDALSNALRSNGLVLQIADGAAHGAHVISRQLLRARGALFNVHSAHDWWSVRLATPEGHAMLIGLLRVLLLTLVPAVALEWLMRRAIIRPHRAIVAHAHRDDDAERATPPAAAAREAAQQQTPEASGTVAVRKAATQKNTQKDAEKDALRAAAGMGTQDPEEHQGVDANAIAADASEVPAASDTSYVRNAAALAREALHRSRGAHHWGLLKRLPLALVLTLLDLVPVIAFGLCAAGVLSLSGPEDAAPAAAVGHVVDTWVICRIIIAVGKLLFAPDSDDLRLMPMTAPWAAFSQRWLARIVVIGGVCGVLAGAVPLGMTEDAHLALVKLVILVAHVALAIMILQCRHAVADRIRHSPAARGSFAWLVHWFADIWAIVAVFVVMALWFVWALDLRGGYQELIRAGGISLGVLLVARMIAIVALGALGRVFDPYGKGDNLSITQRRAYRYYPALRRVVMGALWIIMLDVLLHVWGLHPGRFLINAPIGHLLGSALLTIAVAIVVAIVIWEAANGVAERRLNAWTDAGDYVRAARLRTLLPMFRTTLFVAIFVVVGLTALSQLGINTAPLIAGASIFGVALGFGSQKLVQDFITGIFLLTENAMQVGDWVTVAGVSGTVEFLSIRTVRLRGGDGSLYTVPFSSVTTVNNTNRGIGNAAVKVMIANGKDLERAVATLEEIGAAIRADDAFKSGILSDFAYWGVDSVDGASVTLVGQIQCKDSSRWSVQREFNRRVLTTFTERGIELANPQRNFLVNMSNEHDVEDRTLDDDERDDRDDAKDTRGRPASASGSSAKTRNGQNTPRGKPN